MNSANWLLSALAQTAGALVAIVGGFLVSRLVGLSSQRNGLLERKASVGKRLDVASRRELESRSELVAWEKGLLASSLVWDLADVRGDRARLDLNGHETHTLTREEANECIGRLSNSVVRAFTLFQANPVEHDSPREMLEFAALHGLEIGEEDRLAFSTVYSHLRMKAPKPAPRTTSFLGIPMPDVNLIRNPTVDLLGGMSSMQEQQFEASFHNNLIADWKAAKHDAITLRLQCESLETSIAELGRPSGLVSSALILSYLCVSGVVVPLALLPAEQLSPAGKWAILGSFFLGLVALVWNLAWSIVRLGRGLDP